MTDVRRYRIVSYGELPLRLKGTLDYATAYKLVCDWNSAHSEVLMAWLEAVEP